MAMIGIRTISMALAAPALMSVAPGHWHGPASPAKDSTAPIRTAMHHGTSMRAMISMSAAVVQAKAPTTIRLYDGLGRISFPITTGSPDAQRYFDQGLGFAYGFNHAAAGMKGDDAIHHGIEYCLDERSTVVQGLLR